ncbi:hypothetical protein F2Q70_00014770 [Brassica cretica]|uniref:Uncharacterized protein n=1 Tax=Brassica cretica TaxID=69181 RepID=A0A8S9I3N9_BRACR|nr:hypothetical protein F2Q70_00014770 [Brassica cretica]KAF2599383.1 hypothetical protein F2Q68_00007860 [Brassica cretica]
MRLQDMVDDGDRGRMVSSGNYRGGGDCHSSGGEYGGVGEAVIRVEICKIDNGVGGGCGGSDNDGDGYTDGHGYGN